MASKDTPPRPQQPHWLSPDLMVDPLFTGSVSDWLLDTNSLTHRLRVEHAERFNIKLLGWQPAPLFESEVALLNLNNNQNTWVREVVLRSGQTPLVFARSVMSGQNTALMETLCGLGSQSLGDYLFKSPEVLRGEMQIAKVTSEMQLLKPFLSLGLTSAKSGWARRCVYKIGQARLLVNEVYMPSIFR